MDFFITGLPRSRTAWLANFLTSGGVYCHHDASRMGALPSKLQTLAEETRKDSGAHLVGNSDSGLVLTARMMVKAFPRAQWVLVHRDVHEVVESYLKYFGEHPYPQTPFISESHAKDMIHLCQTFFEHLPELIPVGRLLQVEYADLDREETVRAIWDWCAPGAHFPRRRWEMLKSFNVSIVSEKVTALSAEDAGWMEAMA